MKKIKHCSFRTTEQNVNYLKLIAEVDGRSQSYILNKMIDALKGGWADSKILQTHGKRMIDKDFTPKGKTSTHLKDMNNILECARNSNTQLPISNLVKEMYKTLVKNGHGEEDHSSLYKEIERINNE